MLASTARTSALCSSSRQRRPVTGAPVRSRSYMSRCGATSNGAGQRESDWRAQRACTVRLGLSSIHPRPPALTPRVYLPTARRATDDDKKSLIDAVDCFIFDCDGEWHGMRKRVSVGASTSLHATLNGCAPLSNVHRAGVIWRGDSVIDGVPETLDMLRAMVRTCGHATSAWARLAAMWLCCCQCRRNTRTSSGSLTSCQQLAIALCQSVSLCSC